LTGPRASPASAFFALWPVFRDLSLLVVGTLICALAIAAMLTIPAHAGGLFLWGCGIGLGNAAILWTSAALRLRRAAQILPR